MSVAPAQTISEVIHQLEIIIEEAKKNSSRLGYFPALYKRVTVEVKNKIEQNYFDDNARMEKLDVIFANRYLAAYQSYKKAESCSACWRVAFDATNSWRPLVLQHLFLGMNAHISLDLSIAAATVAPGSAISSLHNDFNKINSVLSALVDTVQLELAQLWPLLKIVDKVAGSLDEKLAEFSMTIARDAAWKNAEEYAMLQPEQQQEFVNARDKKVAAVGQKIYQPGVLLQSAIALLRVGEIGNVMKKIDILDK